MVVRLGLRERVPATGALREWLAVAVRLRVGEAVGVPVREREGDPVA